MTRRRKTPILVIVVLLTLTVGAAPGAAQGAQAAPPAAQTLARCVQLSGRLLVLVLIDESGSLHDTDPSDQRIAGLKSALTGIVRLADTPSDGRTPSAEVLLVGFSAGVHPDPNEPEQRPAWRQATTNSIDTLLSEASEFAGRDNGLDTDYGTALIAARRLFAERSAALTVGGGSPPCKALVWFTDGKYEIDDRRAGVRRSLPPVVEYAPNVRLDQPGGGARAVDAGKDYLCRSGGLMDQLNNDGIVTFTVALSTGLATDDSAFLNALTTGAPNGSGCGSRLSPSTGLYLPVNDSGELFFIFSELFTSPIPRGPAKTVCARARCPEGIATFETVPGVSRFLIRASTGAEGIEVDLGGPVGPPQRLRVGGPGQLPVSGAKVTQRWVSPTQVELEGDLALSGPDSLGSWTFAFIDPTGDLQAKPPTYTVQLFADLSPALVGEPELTVGETTQLDLALADASGRAVTSGPLARGARLTATATDPVAGSAQSLSVSSSSGDGRFTAPLSVPIGTTAGYLIVDVEANFPSAAGIEIASQRRSFKRPTRFPEAAAFPRISPLELRLPSIRGDGTTTGTLTVSASQLAGGCAWIGPAALSGPSEAGNITVDVAQSATSADRCIRVERGQSRAVTIRFRPDASGTGTVRGMLPVSVISDVSQGERTTAVETSFELLRPPNVPKRVLILVLLTTAGVLFPLLLLHGLNLVSARFTAPQRLLSLSREVRVRRGREMEGIDGSPVSAPYGDFELVSGSGGEQRGRRLTVDGIELHTVASGRVRDRVFSLFSGPYGVASADGRQLVAGADQPLRSWPDCSAHEVPLALPGTWLFYPTAIHEGTDADVLPVNGTAPEQVDGRLVLLIADGGGTKQGERVLGSARRRIQASDFSSAEAKPEGGGGLRGLVDRLRGTRRTSPADPAVADASAAPPTPEDSGHRF